MTKVRDWMIVVSEGIAHATPSEDIGWVFIAVDFSAGEGNNCHIASSVLEQETIQDILLQAGSAIQDIDVDSIKIRGDVIQ